VTSSPESNDVARYGLLIVGGNLSHQENYSRALAADPRVRLVGLTDESDVPPRRRELNQALADELEIPYIEPYEEALAREDVDLVCLCPEPERRARMTVAAARAGKHVYVDKPLCATVEGAREVVEAVEASGVRSQMFSLVRSSIGRRCREVVESGQLGTLVGLHAELLFAKGVAGTADLDQPRREQASDGRFTWVDSKRELFCVGLYPLVLFEWLTGSRVESVEAATANFFFTEHQANGAEDFAALLVGWEGGVETTITVGRSGWSSHPSHGIHQVHLVGTDSTATVDAYRPRLEIFSDGRVLAINNFRTTEGYSFQGFKRFKTSRQNKGHHAELNALVDRVRSGGPPLMPFEQIRNVSLASICAFDSAQRGSVIEI